MIVSIVTFKLPKPWTVAEAAAEACYTQDWKAMVTQKYGAPPDILCAEVPVSVDNLKKVIVPA